MNARDIEIFRSVMVSGTASKTATLLGISQSAVSQSIRKLESSADICLFERIRGRLVPTREAQILLNDIEQHFIGMQAIEHRIRSLKSDGSDRLFAAVYPALGFSFLPRVVASFRERFPETFVSLQIMSSKDVHAQVTSGQADFGLMADEMSLAGLEHSLFYRTQSVVVMRQDHPLGHKAIIDLTDFHDRDFIALNAEDSSRRRLDTLFDNAGVVPRRVVETPYSQTVCELARQGVGIGLANPVTAIGYADRGLIVKRIAFDVEFRAILLFRTDKLFSESSKQFLKFLRIEMNQIQTQIEELLGPEISGHQELERHRKGKPDSDC